MCILHLNRFSTQNNTERNNIELNQIQEILRSREFAVTAVKLAQKGTTHSGHSTNNTHGF